MKSKFEPRTQLNIPMAFFFNGFQTKCFVIVPSSNVGNVTNAVKQKTSVKNKRDICWYNGSSRKRTPSGVRTQKGCP